MDNITDIITHTLPSGLRIMHLPIDLPVVYCGYAVAAGARDEAPDEQGLAHFCEHMTFKGTEHLSPLQVINTLERVGGELNAFTTKEDTFFYAAVLKEHFPKAVKLLTDIVFHSTYPQEEIDKEVEVVCDEIESYKDSPADLIYDEFENYIFKGDDLGHNILGEAERVRKFTTDDCLRFTKRNYTPANSVLYILGTPHLLAAKPRNTACKSQSAGQGGGEERMKPLLRMLEKADPALFDGGGLATTPAIAPEALQDGFTAHSAVSPVTTVMLPRLGENWQGTFDLAQCHVMAGTSWVAEDQRERVAMALLNNMLGGPSMNSRLNLSLREKRGLVYSVDSTLVTYRDRQLWTVYFGSDPEDAQRCLRLIRSEIAKFQHKPLSPMALRMAKQQMKGQIALASVNRENYAIDMAKQYLHRGTLKSNERTFALIDAVTAADVQKVACKCLAMERLSTLVMK